IDPPDGRADERPGEQAEIAAAADREVRPEEPERPDRELDQAPITVAPDLIRKARGAPVSVAVVRDRIDARVVPEAFLGEDLVGPALGPADREVRRAIPHDRLPGD